MTGIDQIKRKVKNIGLPMVVALGGEARALVDEALSFLRAQALLKDSAGLNHHRFVVGEDDIGNVISTLQTVPFLSDKRLVELHGAEKLDASLVGSIIEYLERPLESSLLIIIFNKIDKRSKLVSALTTKELLVLFDLANEQDRIKFVQQEAEVCGISIGTSAAHFLDVIQGGDLLAIKAAIKKLSLLFEGRDVTIDDMENHLVMSHEQDVFLFARAVSEGKLPESLFALGQVRKNQENAIKLLGVLVWQFRTLVHIRHCFDEGMVEWDIRKQVSVFGDRFSWMAQVAKKRPALFHVNRLTKLLDYDLALKSQSISDPLNLIEKAVYQSVAGI